MLDLYEEKIVRGADFAICFSLRDHVLPSKNSSCKIDTKYVRPEALPKTLEEEYPLKGTASIN